jgi:hypothetical protein
MTQEQLREQEIYVHVEVWRNMDHCDVFSYVITKPAYVKPLYDRKNKGLDIMERGIEVGSFDTYKEAMEKGIEAAAKLLI